MLCDLQLNPSGSGVSVTNIARRPVSKVRGGQCLRVSLLSSSVEQMEFVSKTCVVYVEKMRIA